MQIASFLPHYQLVCISFDISSFSLISYKAIHALLHESIFRISRPFRGSARAFSKLNDRSEGLKGLFSKLDDHSEGL